MSNFVSKKIKVCLITISGKNDDELYTPINIATLGSFLIDKKTLPRENIKILITNQVNYFEILSSFKPELVGISTTTPYYPEAIKLAKKIKNKFNPIVIIGGHHISGSRDIANTPFDAGVIGEGEGALTDIINILNEGKKLNEKTLSDIKNVVYKKNDGKIKVNPLRDLLDQKDIPQINWSLIPYENSVRFDTVIKNGVPVVAKTAWIFTVRGCPYKCRFCARQIIWPGNSGLRFFSTNNVVEEICFFYNKYKVNNFLILDDTFAISKKRILNLIEELERLNLLGKISFSRIFVRANLIDEEFVDILKKLGVISVSIGMESGSQKVLNFLKNEGLKVSDIKNAVRLFQEKKIYVIGSFMLFSPIENRDDIRKTYNLANWFCKKDNALELWIFPTIPFPGTELWSDFVYRDKTNKEIDWKQFSASAVIKNKFKFLFFPSKIDRNSKQKYWKEFDELKQSLQKRTTSLSGYGEMLKNAEFNNDLLKIKYHRIRAIFEMKARIKRLFKNPKKSISRMLNNKNFWGYIKSDLDALFRTK